MPVVSGGSRPSNPFTKSPLMTPSSPTPGGGREDLKMTAKVGKLALGLGRSVKPTPPGAVLAPVAPPKPTTIVHLAAPSENELVLGVFDHTSPIPDHDDCSSQTFKVKGSSFSKYDLRSLAQGQRLRLVHDPLGAVVKPDEGHPDPDAVSIQDSAGVHIAYVPAAIAGVIQRGREKFTQRRWAATVDAVLGGYVGAGGKMLSLGLAVTVVAWDPAEIR